MGSGDSWAEHFDADLEERDIAIVNKAVAPVIAEIRDAMSELGYAYDADQYEQGLATGKELAYENVLEMLVPLCKK